MMGMDDEQDDVKKVVADKIVLEESLWIRMFTSMWFWAAVIVVVCLVFPLVVEKMMFWGWGVGQLPVNYGSNRGEFGDQYGMLNALFSGLAFAGVITALYFQRKEIELQREELRLQRAEMEAATEEQARHRGVFEMQQKEQERQRFENSFNSFVGLMHEARRAVAYEDRNGSAAMRVMYEKLKNLCDRRMKICNNDYELLKKDIDACKAEILCLCRGWAASWSMCGIHVDNSILKNNEKKFYFDYLRDILDNPENDILKLCMKKLEAALVKNAKDVCKKNVVFIFKEDGEEWWEKV